MQGTFEVSVKIGHADTFPDSFSCRHEKSSGTVRALNRYVTLQFRDRRDAALLCYRNRPKITFLMCEQKPYPV